MAGAGFGAHGGADSVPSLRRLAPLGAFRAHALSGFVVQICSSLAVRGCDFACTRISADYVLELRRLAPLGAFRAHALWIFQPMTLPS